MIDWPGVGVFGLPNPTPPTPAARTNKNHTSLAPTDTFNHSVMQDGAKMPFPKAFQLRRLKSEAGILTMLHCYCSIYQGNMFPLHQTFVLERCSN